MPVEIFLSKENAEPEYETISEDELLDTDEVVERIHEDAKMEERENENGEKEMVEVSPATDKVKIVKRPESVSDPKPLWTKHPNECTKECEEIDIKYVEERSFWIDMKLIFKTVFVLFGDNNAY